MAYSRFVNAFSRISKNHVFRLQILCHIDLMLPSFCFRWVGCVCGGGGGEGGIWYFIQLQCTHIKVKFKGNPQCSNMRSFVHVIKNNEDVLVIK